MNIPRRQHYLSRFYLNNFVNSNKLLWVFDRKNNEYREQSTKDTAVQCDYYAFQGKDDKKHIDEIENFFSIIESDTKPILSKLDKKELINENEKEILATFIAFQKTRVPAFERECNYNYENVVKTLSKKTFFSEEITEKMMSADEKSNISPKIFFDVIQNDKYYFKFPREYSLKLMLDITKEFINSFMQMDWFFAFAPINSSFITSDNPFFLLPPIDYKPGPFSYGITTHGTKKVIPLTPFICLVMGDRGNIIDGKIYDRKIVRSINICCANNSNRFIIARDKSLLTRVMKNSQRDDKKQKE